MAKKIAPAQEPVQSVETVTEVPSTDANEALPTVQESITAVITDITLLDGSAKLADVVAKLNEIIGRVNGTKASRNRGPSSTREMTDEDARRVMIGDLKEKSHKEAAEALNLSYGQVYSARKGFTFKPIYKEASKH